MDREFVLFHGASLSKKKGIFKYVVQKVLDLLNETGSNIKVPYEVLHCLVCTRTYIRLRILNRRQSKANMTRKKGGKLKKYNYVVQK